MTVGVVPLPQSHSKIPDPVPGHGTVNVKRINPLVKKTFGDEVYLKPVSEPPVEFVFEVDGPHVQVMIGHGVRHLLFVGRD